MLSSPDLRTFPVRFSHLKAMSLSPAHYRAAVLADRKETPAMRMGKLVHAVLLGGATIAVFAERRAGKAWDSFKAANDGKLLVTDDEYERASRVAEAISRHRVAASLLVGEHEREVRWADGNRICESHIDVLGDGFVTELKTTTRSVAPERFPRMALGMGYHAQVAFYQDAAKYIQRPAPRGHIVAVETNAPFSVVAFNLTPRALEEGRRLNRLWMERLRVCEEANVWPGYCEAAVDLDVDEGLDLLIDGEEVAA